MAKLEEYWEISGPRKYLHIPPDVPDYWCARVSFHFPSKLPTIEGWGPTMSSAIRAVKQKAREQGILDELIGR